MITTIYSEDADGNRVQLALEKLILVNDEGLEMEILFHKAKDRDFTMHVSDPSQKMSSQLELLPGACNLLAIKATALPRVVTEATS